MNEAAVLPAKGMERAAEVLAVFLRLGFTCFGGPIAHLGYFRAEFVEKRGWLNEVAYADLVGLCQFLPGPSSSQVAFAIGLLRGGWYGALAAWAGFTLPSAIALVLFAYGADWLSGRFEPGIIHGLKLVAVAVVAQAVLGMARSLCPDRTRATFAMFAAMSVLFLPTAVGQVFAIVMGAALGYIFCGPATSLSDPELEFGVSARLGLSALFALLVCLLGLPFAAAVTGSDSLKSFNAFYRAGALVSGGGHVVLPLLQDAVVAPGWVNNDLFLSGYGAAQAVPGPLFSFAAYLGAVSSFGLHGVWGAALCLIAIFLPGNLVLIGTLPFWSALQARPGTQSAVRGVNASVVGILATALYSPIWTSSIRNPYDLVIALVGFVLLVAWKAPPLLVVAMCGIAGMLLSQYGQIV